MKDLTLDVKNVAAGSDAEQKREPGVTGTQSLSGGGKQVAPGVKKLQCMYLDENGMCTGRYRGFACLENRCPFYERIIKNECPFRRGDGYCTVYGRFYCPGTGMCEITFRIKPGDDRRDNNDRKDGKR